MGKIIAIANQKGGVGKTTTSISLGAGLVKRGKKVCILDFDPQGNATEGLGYDSENQKVTITTILNKIINKDYSFPFDYGVLHHEEGMDLIPANIDLATMEMQLISVYIGREKILCRYLDLIKSNYDYIIIDCKPSLDIVTLNALTAADSVLIPVQAQFYSAKGLEQLLGTITQIITDGLNPSLKIEGILFTVVNEQTNNFKKVSDIVKNAYGECVNIYTSYIPRSVRAEEAPATGNSIYEFDPKGTVAIAYNAFVDEFMKMEE